MTRTAEHNKKISIALKGRIFSESHRRNMSLARKGDKCPSWNGGRCVDSNGYVRIYSPHHPLKNIKGYVYEHRLVIEDYIDRFLSRKEHVHHVNGKTDDNRIDNLMLFGDMSSHLIYEKTGKLNNLIIDGRAVCRIQM